MTTTAIDDLGRYGIVPVVVLERAADAAGLGEALVAGGLPVAEVTFRTAAAAESIRILAERGDVIVGAGTVLNVAQAEAAIEAGARFVVSPGLSADIVRCCQAAGLPMLPGATTATEVMAALDLGVSTVKFFPASTSGGAPAIKALAAPFGEVTFVPTGGIGTSNLADYLGLTCVVAVGGSWMVPAAAIASGDLGTIENLTREAVELARSIR